LLAGGTRTLQFIRTGFWRGHGIGRIRFGQLKFGMIAPSSGSTAPLSPVPSGSNGLIQSPRGSLAVGQVADRISSTQAQSFANQSGTPFTQAFSNGSVVTHQADPEANNGVLTPTVVQGAFG